MEGALSILEQYEYLIDQMPQQGHGVGRPFGDDLNAMFEQMMRRAGGSFFHSGGRIPNFIFDELGEHKDPPHLDLPETKEDNDPKRPKWAKGNHHPKSPKKGR